MSKGRILTRSDAVCFQMPSLEEDASVKTLLQRAEEIERLAYDEGFASGERAGSAAGEEMAAVMLERLERMLQELSAFRENLVSSLEPQVVDIAIAIAKKVIIEEVRTQPDIIVTMVRESLRKLQRVGDITIRINPALQELFARNRPQLLEIHPDIVFEVNSNIPVTAPLVISAIEEVVTDIDSLLENVVKEMKMAGIRKSEEKSRKSEAGNKQQTISEQQTSSQ